MLEQHCAKCKWKYVKSVYWKYDISPPLVALSLSAIVDTFHGVHYRISQALLKSLKWTTNHAVANPRPARGDISSVLALMNKCFLLSSHVSVWTLYCSCSSAHLPLTCFHARTCTNYYAAYPLPVRHYINSFQAGGNGDGTPTGSATAITE